MNKLLVILLAAALVLAGCAQPQQAAPVQEPAAGPAGPTGGVTGPAPAQPTRETGGTPPATPTAPSGAVKAPTVTERGANPATGFAVLPGAAVHDPVAIQNARVDSGRKDDDTDRMTAAEKAALSESYESLPEEKFRPTVVQYTGTHDVGTEQRTTTTTNAETWECIEQYLQLKWGVTHDVTLVDQQRKGNARAATNVTVEMYEEARDVCFFNDGAQWNCITKKLKSGANFTEAASACQVKYV